MHDTSHEGYRKTSITLHWLSALILLALFVSALTKDEIPLLISLHSAIGPLGALILIYHVVYRLRLGLPRQSRWSLSQLTIRVFLVCIPVAAFSGLLVPWTHGNPLNIAGVHVSAPEIFSPAYYSLTQWLHKLSAFLIIPALVLHILFSNNPERMFNSDSTGY